MAQEVQVALTLVARNVRPNRVLVRLTMETTMAPCMVARSGRLKLISIMELVGLEVPTTTMAALTITLEVAELAAQTLTILVDRLTMGLTLAACMVARSVRPNMGLVQSTMEITLATCGANDLKIRLSFCENFVKI